MRKVNVIKGDMFFQWKYGSDTVRRFDEMQALFEPNS